ncbi:MAG: helix-turn-helix transcriptional regulator [bacterium]|nr:helix-turn-helix transcriptional regulator [bacterium]
MKQELKKEIGRKIRVFRKTLGLTQAQMVTHFDVGRANYSRIEKGEVFPNASILFTLKKKFDISLDWLICDEGQMLPEDSERGRGNSSSGVNEVKDLMGHMDKVPMIKHAVLGFFLEYKAKNFQLIQQEIEMKEKKVSEGNG